MGAHGRFDNQATDRSLQLWANMHRGWLALAGAGIALAVGALLAERNVSKPKGFACQFGSIADQQTIRKLVS